MQCTPLHLYINPNLAIFLMNTHRISFNFLVFRLRIFFQTRNTFVHRTGKVNNILRLFLIHRKISKPNFINRAKINCCSIFHLLSCKRITPLLYTLKSTSNLFMIQSNDVKTLEKLDDFK